jgi:hypothetical protein
LNILVNYFKHTFNQDGGNYENIAIFPSCLLVYYTWAQEELWVDGVSLPAHYKTETHYQTITNYWGVS